MTQNAWTQSDSNPSSGVDLRESDLRPANLSAENISAYMRDIERLKARKKEFIAVPCPACDSGGCVAAFEKYEFAFVRCTSCRTLYMTPRPSPGLLADYHATSEGYAFWVKHIYPVSEDIRREKIHKPSLDRVHRLCDRYGLVGGELLEVGPGFGTFADLAAKSGFFQRVTVVEPAKDMAVACRQRGLQVVEKPIELIGQEIGPVDILVAFEVIEHLFRPKDFLKMCAKLVRVGGIIVLSCPNGMGFDIEVLGPKSSSVDADHINLFNPDSLRSLLRRSGFEAVDITTPGRLDAELVRTAAISGDFDLSSNPFLRRVLLDEWERLGGKFQRFLADNDLSSHMWLAARRTGMRDL
jgi:2-polyprenyl-3-methyl-5-hydroxy-6-metoxy-1,4-benzoquinol methylase